MAEKRKPSKVILLKKRSKREPGKWVTVKVEMYPSRLWDDRPKQRGVYRIRVNGKWWKDGEWLSISRLFGIMCSSMEK